MLIEFKVQNQSICLHHVLCLVSHDIHVTVSAVKFWWFYVWFKAVLDLTSQDWFGEPNPYPWRVMSNGIMRPPVQSNWFAQYHVHHPPTHYIRLIYLQSLCHPKHTKNRNGRETSSQPPHNLLMCVAICYLSGHVCFATKMRRLR